MPIIRCPICEKRFESTASKALPFCGERCRKIDLGRWLGESYKFLSMRVDDEEGDETLESPDEEA